MNTTHTSTRPAFDVRSLVISGLATACLAVAATGARAQDGATNAEATKMVVNYGDLNLANAKGVETLYARIASAARQVCDSGESRSLGMNQRDRACMKRSIAGAVVVVNVPALTALHAQKTGQPDRTIELAKE